MAIPIYSYPQPTTACYASVPQVKFTINSSSNGSDLVNAADDSMLLWFIEAASRVIDEHCNRYFYPYVQTRKYDWRGQTLELYFGQDLLSLTTLTNGDGSVIPATGSNNLANYFLYPANQFPKYKLQLAINQSLAWTYTNTPQQALSVLAIWGYPSDPNTGAYYTSVAGCTMVNAQLAADTTFTVPTNTIAAGQTLYFTATNEFVLVQSVSVGPTNDTLTVKRGMFGSTAAAITQGAQVYVALYHPVVVRNTYRLAAWYYRQKDSQTYDMVATRELGQIRIPSGMPRDVTLELDTLRYRRIGLAR